MNSPLLLNNIKPNGTVSGDIFLAHMRRAGLLPEEEEEFAEKMAQVEYSPIPESTVSIGREKTFAEVAESGFISGLAGGFSGLVGAAESFGFGGELTDSLNAYLGGVEMEHAPPEEIQNELRHDPYLLLNPLWWAYNVPSFAASTVPMLVGGGGAGVLLKSIARIAPALIGAGGASVARTAFGGALNMMTVGGGVYAEAVEGGMAHREAARLSHTSMIVDAPWAFLESMLFLNPKLMGKLLPKGMRSTTRKGAIAQSSLIESIQETGETLFADNMVTGKPWSTGLLEAAISGPVVGGPIAAVQGPQFDAAINHAKIAALTESYEPIDGLGDPDLDDDQIIKLTDQARDPEQSPERVAFLEASAGRTREGADAIAVKMGNQLPLSDLEWESMVKKDLRMFGFFETQIDGVDIDRLEFMRNVAARREDRVVNEPVVAIRGAGLRLGDTFTLEGHREGDPLYRVTTSLGVDLSGRYPDEVGSDPESTEPLDRMLEATDVVTGKQGIVLALNDEKIKVRTRSRLAGAKSPQLPIPIVETAFGGEGDVGEGGLGLEMSQEAVEARAALDETGAIPIDVTGQIPGQQAAVTGGVSLEEVEAGSIRPVSIDVPGTLSTPQMDQDIIAQIDAETAADVVEMREAGIAPEEIERLVAFAGPTEAPVAAPAPAEPAVAPAATPTPAEPAVAPAATPTPAEVAVEPVAEPEFIPTAKPVAPAVQPRVIAEGVSGADVFAPSVEALEPGQALEDIVPAAVAREAEPAAEPSTSNEQLMAGFRMDQVNDISMTLLSSLTRKEISFIPDDVRGALFQRMLTMVDGGSPNFNPDARRLAAEFSSGIDSALLNVEHQVPAAAAREAEPAAPAPAEVAAALSPEEEADFKARFPEGPESAIQAIVDRGYTREEAIAVVTQPIGRRHGPRGEPVEGAVEISTEEIMPTAAEVAAEEAVEAAEEAALIAAGVATTTTPGREVAAEVAAEEAVEAAEEAALIAAGVATTTTPAREVAAEEALVEEAEPAPEAPFLPDVAAPAPAPEPDPDLFSGSNVFKSMTDADILELSNEELTDWIETTVQLGGLGLRSMLSDPFKSKTGKLIKPSSFMKPNKKRLLEIIRSKYTFSAEIKATLEAAAPTPAPTPAAEPAAPGTEPALTSVQNKAVRELQRSGMARAEAIAIVVGEPAPAAPGTEPMLTAVQNRAVRELQASGMTRAEAIAIAASRETRASLTTEAAPAARVADAPFLPEPKQPVPTKPDVLDDAWLSTASERDLIKLGHSKLKDLALSVGVAEGQITRGSYIPTSGVDKGKRTRSKKDKAGVYFPATIDELIRLIRLKRPVSGVTELEAEPVSQEAPPAPEQALPEDSTDSFGMSDEEAAILFENDFILQDQVQEAKEKAGEELPEAAERRQKLVDYETAETVAVWVTDMKVFTEDGKDGRLVVTDSGPHRVRVEGEKELRFYKRGELELVGDILRVKPSRANVSDDVIAEAKRRLRGKKDTQWHKLFKDKAGKVSLDEFKKFATTLGIRLHRNATRPDVVNSVRIKLANKKGSYRQDPTDTGDLLTSLARQLGVVGDIQVGDFVSGFILQDGTYIDIGKGTHNGFALKVYDAAGIDVARDEVFDAFLGDVQARSENALEQFLADTGAVRVAIDTIGPSYSATGEFGPAQLIENYSIIYETTSQPSQQQTLTMSDPARSGLELFKTYTLEMRGWTNMKVIDADEHGPTRTKLMIRNFWLRGTSLLDGFRQDMRSFGGTPSRQLDLFGYTEQELNPLGAEADERLAIYVANNGGSNQENPMAWARRWVLKFDNHDAALKEVRRIWADTSGLDITADMRRSMGISEVPTTVKFVTGLVKSEAEIGSPRFLAAMSDIATAIRNIVSGSDVAKLQQIEAAIRKDVNRRLPLAVSTQHVINVLRPNRIKSSSWMPDPDDAKGVTVEKAPPWNVPLENPLEETLAQQKVALGVTGAAGRDLGDLDNIPIERARQDVWESTHGALVPLYKNGIIRSLKNPDKYKANDDLLIRVPRVKDRGHKTLLHTVQRMMAKGKMMWQGTRINRDNPHGDFAVLGQVIRDARVENYVIWYLNDDNVVVGADVISSGLPSKTDSIEEIGWEYASAKAGMLGATKVMSSHNHPTGVPGPASDGDAKAIVKEHASAAAVGLEHMGHMILDNNIYGILETDGTYEIHKLPSEIRKDLHRGVFLNELTTPGLEAKANNGINEDTDIEQSREHVLRAHYSAGVTLSAEDSATIISMFGGRSASAYINAVAVHSARLARDTETVIAIQVDATYNVTSVESIDIETMRDEELVRDILDKRAAGAYRTFIFLSGDGATRDTDTNAGYDQTVEGFIDRLYHEKVIEGYIVNETHKGDVDGTVEAGRTSQDYDTTDGYHENFRSKYAGMSPEDQELVLYSMGKAAGLRPSEMQGGGMWQMANMSREDFELYKSHGGQLVIDSFVNMGANKGIEFKMLRPLEPGENPVNMPWREMTERSWISRSNRMTRGESFSEGGFREDPPDITGRMGRVTKPIKKMWNAVRREREAIPRREDEPDVNLILDHMRGGRDVMNKHTSAQAVLASEKTMLERLFQSFEIKDLRGVAREAGNVFENIKAGRGIKRSFMAGLKRINPFMAKWLYDTEHALTVWTDIVNEHRLSKGVAALSFVKNPRNAVDLARNVSGAIELQVRKHNAILMSYGEEKDGKALGLLPQEESDVDVFLNALQSKRRISVAKGRYDRLEVARTEALEHRMERTRLANRLRSAPKEDREEIANNVRKADAMYKELRREVVTLRKIVVMERVRNDEGQIIDRRWNEELINPGQVTTAQAEAAIEQIKSRVGVEKSKKLDVVAEEMSKFWDGMLDISLDAGIISQTDFNQMKQANFHHGNYMSPFDILRHYNTTTQSGAAGSRGSISIFDHHLYEAMVGTTSDIRDPLMTAVDKISATVSLAAKNKAMRTFHDSRLLWDNAVDENGNDVVDPDLDGVMMPIKEGQEVPEGYRRVHYWRDGKRVSFAAYSPIADALLGINRPVAGTIMNAVKIFTKYLRVGATALSPSFIAFNVPRDLFTQYIAADNPIRITQMRDVKLLLNSTLAAMRASWSPDTIDPVLAEFMAWNAGYGGEIQQQVYKGEEEDVKHLGLGRRTVLGRDISDPQSAFEKLLRITSNVFRTINPFGSGITLSEAMEQGTRFALFQKQLQETADLPGGVDITRSKTGIFFGKEAAAEAREARGRDVAELRKAASETKQRAIFAGRRSTVDFSRGGRAFLFANMVAPFTNAAVQGVRTTAGGVMRHPERAAWLLAYGVMLEMTLAIANRMNFGDLLDDEEDWLKRKTFTLIVGEVEDPDGTLRPDGRRTLPVSLHFPKGDLLSAATVPFQDFFNHAWKSWNNPNVAFTDGGEKVFGTLVEMLSEASPIEFERNGKISLGLIMSRFLPVPFRSTLELMTDKNFYFNREIEGRLKGMLTEDRIKRDTTDFAIFMSRVAGSVFDVVGDRETNPFSPVVIDELTRAYFAEGGAIAARLAGSAVNIITDPFSPVTFGASASSAMFGRGVGADEWSDHLKTLAYTPFVKRFLSVRGGRQERLQMEALERADQIMGSRRAALIRPVRAFVAARKRGRLTGDAILETMNSFTPEQISLLEVELEREERGLGPTESVARTLRSMGIRNWSRAVGIVEIMNEVVISPRERVQFLHALSFSEVLTPTVLSQVMLLAGNGALRRPDSVLPGVPGLQRVSRLTQFRDPSRLPFFPETAGRTTRRQRSRRPALRRRRRQLSQR